MYSIAPFVILGLVNSFLIYQTLASRGIISRTQSDKVKRRNASFSVVMVTIAFIVLTLPNAIAGGYFIAQLFSTELGTLILFITDCFAFTFHSFNFVVFLFSNKRFNEEFRNMLNYFRPNNKVTFTIDTAQTQKA